MELYLVRHAPSTRARLGAWGRLVDAPLEKGFDIHLSPTRQALATLQDPVVFSSPLSRCIETAQFLFPGRAVHIVHEFRAYHSGIYEQETEEAVRLRNPDYADLSFRERFLNPRFGEESIAQQAARVAVGLPRVLQAPLLAPVAVVVAHYSTINIIAHICHLNWKSDEYADAVYDLPEGGFVRFVINSDAVLTGLNVAFPHSEISRPGPSLRGN